MLIFASFFLFYYLDGTTRNTASFPSYWNASHGTTTSQHDADASWYNSAWHNATNGGTSYGTGEPCRNLIDLLLLYIFQNGYPEKISWLHFYKQSSSLHCVKWHFRFVSFMLLFFMTTILKASILQSFKHGFSFSSSSHSSLHL